jgi:glycosyltransferase involved in cell wall biosynthesis
MPKGKNTNTNNSQPAKSSPEYFKTYPFVSVCTPTFNRRPFITAMISCFDHQDYPQDRMEWIIIDDGTDPIEDLIASHPRVKYFKYDTKMTLGKKRNLLHEKSRGEILVYMDDDDYYPPERVSHAVHMLVTHPEALCAGSSEIYIYFKHINQMKKFGPYGPNHATAGTFAFKRKLLKQHKYNDEACLAEERAFLKDYTVPFVQLNPMKVILVFSHEHNTFDKRKLLVNANPQVVKDTPKRVMDFIKDPVLRKFYMVDLEKILVDYLPGRPEMKPDVIQQTLQLERDRERMAAEQAQQMNGGGGGDNGQIILQQPGQEPVALSNKQVVEIIQQQQGEIQNRDKKIHQMNEEIKKLQFDLYNLRKVVEKNAENADDDNELKIVEIVDKPANVDTTHVTNQDKNTTNCPPDLMKRYEDLLEENREMRRLLDDLTQTNTNAELM